MDKQTIKTILVEMKEAVENRVTVSPTKWLEWAFSLNVLWQDLKAEMTKYEMLYKQEVVNEIEKGSKVSFATLKIEASSENYKMYSYLKGREEILENFIMLSKKRATLEHYVD